MGSNAVLRDDFTMAQAFTGLDPFPEIVGTCPSMLHLKAQLHQLAQLDVPVLIRGESGAGKELAAHALHRASSRSRRPYVAVNCGAIPRELLESELFGCEPGAFTGARRRDGVVARADRGTLFLDEIGELSLNAQAVLLRVLESGEFSPVGGERVRRADFRLICATHRDLRQMVRAGLFRLDLYHRIAALVVELPPLRARCGDLPLLCRTLLGAEGPSVTRRAMDRLVAHPWPGNVRELKNVLVRGAACAAFARRPGGMVIDVDDLVLEAWDVPSPLTDAGPRGPTSSPSPPLPVRAALGALVRDEVARQAGNVRAAARILGISHTTVYRHLRGTSGLAAPVGQ